MQHKQDKFLHHQDKMQQVHLKRKKMLKELNKIQVSTKKYLHKVNCYGTVLCTYKYVFLHSKHIRHVGAVKRLGALFELSRGKNGTSRWLLSQRQQHGDTRCIVFSYSRSLPPSYAHTRAQTRLAQYQPSASDNRSLPLSSGDVWCLAATCHLTLQSQVQHFIIEAQVGQTPLIALCCTTDLA